MKLFLTLGLFLFNSFMVTAAEQSYTCQIGNRCERDILDPNNKGFYPEVITAKSYVNALESCLELASKRLQVVCGVEINNEKVKNSMEENSIFACDVNLTTQIAIRSYLWATNATEANSTCRFIAETSKSIHHPNYYLYTFRIEKTELAPRYAKPRSLTYQCRISHSGDCNSKKTSYYIKASSDEDAERFCSIQAKMSGPPSSVCNVKFRF